MAFSDEPWSTPESDLTVEQFCSVCLIDYNEGDKIKAKCKLPVKKTPDGPYNKAALRNAAGRIFQMTDVPPEKKRAAARKLISLMNEADIGVSSEALRRLAGSK